MAVAVVKSRALNGMHAPEVVVEAHLANGLPAFTLVGLPETEVVRCGNAKHDKDDYGPHRAYRVIPFHGTPGRSSPAPGAGSYLPSCPRKCCMNSARFGSRHTVTGRPDGSTRV